MQIGALIVAEGVAVGAFDIAIIAENSDAPIAKVVTLPATSTSVCQCLKYEQAHRVAYDLPGVHILAFTHGVFLLDSDQRCVQTLPDLALR